MASVAEYRQHAGECRALARKLKDEQQRNQLLRMAEAWDNFAAQSEEAVRFLQSPTPGFSPTEPAIADLPYWARF
jgi:hypothetical protein